MKREIMMAIKGKEGAMEGKPLLDKMNNEMAATANNDNARENFIQVKGFEKKLLVAVPITKVLINIVALSGLFVTDGIYHKTLIAAIILLLWRDSKRLNLL